MADLKPHRTPQLEHGHTRVANELLMHLAAACTGQQLAVMCVVMRFSYGFQKKKALLTVSEFSRHLGKDRKSIRRTIIRLQARNMLLVKHRPGHHKKTYQVQKDWRVWGSYQESVPTPKPSKRKTNVKVVRVGGEFKLQERGGAKCPMGQNDP